MSGAGIESRLRHGFYALHFGPPKSYPFVLALALSLSRSSRLGVSLAPEVGVIVCGRHTSGRPHVRQCGLLYIRRALFALVICLGREIEFQPLAGGL